MAFGKGDPCSLINVVDGRGKNETRMTEEINTRSLLKRLCWLWP